MNTASAPCIPKSWSMWRQAADLDEVGKAWVPTSGNACGPWAIGHIIRRRNSDLPDRAVGGVIGVWPVSAYFPDMVSYADEYARMAGVVGVGPARCYADLPQLAAALRTKFNPDETAKLLGGNYRRIFQASIG